METCPYCKGELKLNSPADYHSTYGSKSVIAVALCCNNAVVLLPVRSRIVRKYEGPRRQDDWSNDFGPVSP